MTLDELRTQFTAAATAFAQGDPEPVKRLYSQADDVSLANPFGPAVRGWADVSAALDFASSRFRDVASTTSTTSRTTPRQTWQLILMWNIGAPGSAMVSWRSSTSA
jgi:hypothetical protein